MITQLENKYLITANVNGNLVTITVPNVNNYPKLDSLTESVRGYFQTELNDWLAEGNVIPSVIFSVPIIINKDWIGLNNACLGGPLLPLYLRLTSACFVDQITVTSPQLGEANNIAVAKGLIDQSVAVTQIEEAVAAGLYYLLSNTNYRFTNEEILTWNNTTNALGFSSVIHLM